MDKIVLNHDNLLGFDHPSNLEAKVGVKNILDHDELLGFDHPSNLQAKVGDKANVAAEPQAGPQPVSSQPAPEPDR